MPRPALTERTNLPPSPPSSLTAYFPRKRPTPLPQEGENAPPPAAKRGVKRALRREPRPSDADYGDESALRSSPLIRAHDAHVDVDMDEPGRKEAGVPDVGEAHIPVGRRPLERRSLPAWPGLINDLRLGARLLPQAVPTRPHLLSLRSSHHTDTLRFPSLLPTRDAAIPFSLRFTHASATGGPRLLATATEEGAVCLVSAESRGRWDPLPQWTTLTPHENAIFALAFSEDDKLLATASGDRTCVLTDVERQQTVVTLEGHTGSVRRVAWDPSNPQLLATAARDGSFRLWDARAPAGEACTLEVREAHALPPAGRKSRARGAGRKCAGLAKQSVTGLVYAPGREGCVITSGSADGVLKLWDVRSPFAPAELSPDPTPLTSPTRRARGIITLAHSPSSSLLLALSASSTIHAYSALSLSAPAPASAAHALTHERFSAGSFYVGMECSPGGRYLAAGSAGGVAVVWDVMAGLAHRAPAAGAELGRIPGRGAQGPANQGQGTGAASARTGTGTGTGTGVLLPGHAENKECAAVAWANEDVLATAGDDGLVRIWRAGPQEEQAEWWGVRAG
ncbi:WD40 repeat-like protein [Calocera cornea HHB12733]|uniref:WD40 repeat-like protein n=1 Tax=Calocera cornea HHB12733 TaxID=1353952 RepID=A0A165H134_9BASI|nr:WD40 repeat-like protein [Calocera cornea HHB12733]